MDPTETAHAGLMAPAVAAMIHEPAPAALNEHQQRHLYFGLVEIDKLLGDIENIAAAASSHTLFPRYLDDLSPAQRKLLEGSIARLRASLAGLLASQGMKPDRPRIEASGAIRTALIFAEITAEDLGPRNMRGYGALDEAQAREVEGVIAELRSRIDALLRELSPEPAAQLEARIAHLAVSPAQQMLAALERMTREQGLEEFRAGLGLATDRLAAPAMEIAVFGRVSCGKSSLLNYLLGTELLPTGATPITSVPTHIGFGATPALVAQFERQQQQFSGDEMAAQLVALASEQQNPDNRRGVTRLSVFYPSPKLRQGVWFVDTPGLGSIRSWGAMETLAYLPRSDMAILLIDAGAAVGTEELELVRWLQAGGIPVQVLLSKADLVSPGELERGLRFTQEALRSSAAGGVLEVRGVSVRRPELADAWFEQAVLPVYARLRQRFQASIDRRLEVLRAGVLAALEAQPVAAAADPDAAVALERSFRLADAAADKAADRLRGAVQQMLDEATAIAAEVAASLTAAWRRQTHPAAEELRALAGEALGKAMGAHSRPLLEMLGAVGHGFAEALAQAQQALPGLEPGAGATPFAVRDFPMPEVGPLAWNLTLPRLAAFGRGAVEAHFRRQLEAHRDQTGAALRAYAVRVQQRGQAALQDMRRQFAARADLYRAALARLSGALASGAPGAGDLQPQLAWLRQWRGSAGDGQT